MKRDSVIKSHHYFNGPDFLQIIALSAAYTADSHANISRLNCGVMTAYPLCESTSADKQILYEARYINNAISTIATNEAEATKSNIPSLGMKTT